MTHALAEITSDYVLQSCISPPTILWLCEINSLQLGEGTRMGQHLGLEKFVIGFMER